MKSVLDIGSKKNSGFTLVEIMIVVAIISILTAITVPSYQSYISNANRAACLSEVKAYSNNVFYMLNARYDAALLTEPTLSACQSITDATGWTIATQQKIIAVAKSPSNARIECDLPNGSSCLVIP